MFLHVLFEILSRKVLLVGRVNLQALKKAPILMIQPNVDTQLEHFKGSTVSQISSALRTHDFLSYFKGNGVFEPIENRYFLSKLTKVIFICIMANFDPKQARGPQLNGMKLHGCPSFMLSLLNLSGLKTSGFV